MILLVWSTSYNMYPVNNAVLILYSYLPDIAGLVEPTGMMHTGYVNPS